MTCVNYLWTNVTLLTNLETVNFDVRHIYGNGRPYERKREGMWGSTSKCWGYGVEIVMTSAYSSIQTMTCEFLIYRLGVSHLCLRLS